MPSGYKFHLDSAEAIDTLYNAEILDEENNIQISDETNMPYSFREMAEVIMRKFHVNYKVVARELHRVFAEYDIDYMEHAELAKNIGLQEHLGRKHCSPFGEYFYNKYGVTCNENKKLYKKERFQWLKNPENAKLIKQYNRKTNKENNE